MSADDRMHYLANIILVSRADGTISAREQQVIEGICRSIGAGKDERDRALQAVARGDYQVTPVGRFSDKVRNLEDMILIALSDGQLPDSEKKLIRAFSKAININQDQINEMVSESKDRLRLQPAETLCPACHEKCPADSNFCCQCGEKILPAPGGA